MFGVCGRTPPGVRELKLGILQLRYRWLASRTPPGVRELKPSVLVLLVALTRRTPPGVRELKLLVTFRLCYQMVVAPLPGCVN